MSQRGRAPLAKDVDWSSMGARIRWLVETRFDGNRSAFAEAIGCSHTLIFKIIGGQAPGRRLLENIAQQLGVRPAWLLSGEGQPGSGHKSGVPITMEPLPGSPQNHTNLLSDTWQGPQMFLSSQYWLRLSTTQPILQERAYGFLIGDLLLMETDRAQFPRNKLLQDLCVCHVDQRIKLGAVTYNAASVDDGPERLEVDTFDLGLDKREMLVDVVYRHHPNGTITNFERRLKVLKGQNRQKHVRLTSVDHDPLLPSIRYTDIAAVWTRIMHRTEPSF